MGKGQRFCVAVGALLMLCAAFSACGRKSSPPLAQDGTQVHAAYAVLFFGAETEAAEAMRAGVEAQAKAQGKTVDVFSADAHDGEKQQEWLSYCREQEYKAVGIALGRTADSACMARISEAAQHGTALVLFGTLPPNAENTDGIFAFVTADEEKLGALGANYIVSRCTAGGAVAVLAESEADARRVQGAESVLRTATGLQLLEPDTAADVSQSVGVRTARLLQTQPNVTALYCCSGTAAGEAFKAVREADKNGEILIVAVDDSASVLKSADKFAEIAAVSIDYREIGAAAFRKLAEIADGQTPPATPEGVYVEPYIVGNG